MAEDFAVMLIEYAKSHPAKVDFPTILVCRHQANGLATKRFAQEVVHTFPLDGAVGSHPADLKMRGGYSTSGNVTGYARGEDT